MVMHTHSIFSFIWLISKL